MTESVDEKLKLLKRIPHPEGREWNKEEAESISLASIQNMLSQTNPDALPEGTKVEAEPPGASFLTRMQVQGFGDESSKAALAKVREAYPDLQVSQEDGRLWLTDPKTKVKYAFNPAGLDWKDVMAASPMLGAGVAAAGLGVPVSGIQGVLAQGGLGAGTSLARQKIGQYLGVADEPSTSQALTEGAVQGALPLAGVAARGAGGALSSVLAKGASLTHDIPYKTMSQYFTPERAAKIREIAKGGGRIGDLAEVVSSQTKGVAAKERQAAAAELNQILDRIEAPVPGGASMAQDPLESLVSQQMSKTSGTMPGALPEELAGENKELTDLLTMIRQTKSPESGAYDVQNLQALKQRLRDYTGAESYLPNVQNVRKQQTQGTARALAKKINELQDQAYAEAAAQKDLTPEALKQARGAYRRARRGESVIERYFKPSDQDAMVQSTARAASSMERPTHTALSDALTQFNMPPEVQANIQTLQAVQGIERGMGGSAVPGITKGFTKDVVGTFLQPKMAARGFELSGNLGNQPGLYTVLGRQEAGASPWRIFIPKEKVGKTQKGQAALYELLRQLQQENPTVSEETQ